MSTLRKMFIIGLVWPEPNSSAAGARMMQLITHFKTNFSVRFLCAASKSEYSMPLEEMGVPMVEIKLNDSSFDEYIKTERPTVVLYDRYITEEQFGWRVRESNPLTINILDTEDLHFLREVRSLRLKSNSKSETVHYQNEITYRELASIYRSDISLIISRFEMNLLKTTFSMDEKLIFFLPMLSVEANFSNTINSYEDREGFMFIGNFLHEPNWDAVLYLKKEIWPRLSLLCPAASLHIYGAYASQKVLQLNQPKERFFVHGRADDLTETYNKHRVMLAPLRFGAGVKGKLLDAMNHQIPSVTSSIGAESLGNSENWNGAISNSTTEFCEAASELYNQKLEWLDAVQKGRDLYRNLQEEFKNQWEQLDIALENRIQHVTDYRNANFVGNMLNYHLVKSTKYFSKWIEEKNKGTKE